MDVKIVGAASDEEMAEEIEDIARVFVYEQRMKGFTQDLRDQICAASGKKAFKQPPLPPVSHAPPRAPAGYVKGFC